VPLDEAVAREAQTQQTRRGLGPQDALVYASVLGHLRERTTSPTAHAEDRCFVTRDKDFADDDIRADLEALGCRILFRFDAARGFVQNRLHPR